MSRPKNKDEYRQQLAEMFANLLSEKGLDWKKEWIGKGGLAPQNAVTKANYRGCNFFNLTIISALRGYSDPRWATMVQIMDKDKKYHPKENWHLKKGSKAVYVEYWFPYDYTNKKALTWEQYKKAIKVDGREPDEFTLRATYSAVFNADDIEGISKFEIKENPDINADEIVETLSKEMGVPIFYDGGDRAYYSPTLDEIHLPTPESFTNEYAFNSTALHELAHSTGHSTRLNRPQAAFFGTPAYAYEELIAEITSCFMSAELNIVPAQSHLDNHKAYVQGWIQAIKDKPDTLIKAIKEAQSAANYMDYKAGLITEKEFNKVNESVFEVNKKRKEPKIELSK